MLLKFWGQVIPILSFHFESGVADIAVFRILGFWLRFGSYRGFCYFGSNNAVVAVLDSGNAFFSIFAISWWLIWFRRSCYCGFRDFHKKRGLSHNHIAVLGISVVISAIPLRILV